MSGVVIPFTGRVLLAAYRVARRPEIQDDLQLVLAASVLVEALKRGASVPPGTIDHLVSLATRERGDVEFQRRLMLMLAAIQEGRAKPLLEIRGGRRA